MRLKRLWCRLFHHEHYWPVSGFKRCRTCLELVPVAWEEARDVVASRS
jgi:hypothetical protein